MIKYLGQNYPFFYNTVYYFSKGASIKKWASAITRVIERKNKSPLTVWVKGMDERVRDQHLSYLGQFDQPPPEIIYHTARITSEMNLLSVHPTELARQLTIRDYELYKFVFEVDECLLRICFVFCLIYSKYFFKC